MGELKTNQLQFMLSLQDNIKKLKDLKNLSILELPNAIEEIEKDLNKAFILFAETFNK